MKCTRQPRFLADKPTPITEIWEVRLPQTLWRKVRHISKGRRITYSMISRFCAFELAERGALRWRKVLKSLHARDKQEYAQGDHHRHLVCLYGEDAQLLRLAAMRLGISVSALIRLALRLYLRHFDMEFHSKRYVTYAHLFWKAIKRWVAIPQYAFNSLAIPNQRIFHFQSVPPEWRWSYPLQP
jgi:hypothetical protein